MALAPTLYEYYTSGGINYGLSTDQPYFTLNDRNISIYSGAMHYFRIPRQYWRDRLRKLRATGANTVETYVPWNLHEPQPGVYDFGNGGTDFQDFLNVSEFLTIAQEEDLFAIVRPGPYICSEWEFGGMPSWLLREDNVVVRSSDSKFLEPVTRYFNALLPILALLQFTNGGPIIGFQVENEYGSTGNLDTPYLEFLRDLIRSNGIVEQLFTSDGVSSGTRGSVDGALMTANFNSAPTQQLSGLQSLQPDKPVMTMEFWTGWYDRWGEGHNTVSVDDFGSLYEAILSFPASVSMYMFHGGTNFGFMNGANIVDSSTDNGGYQPIVTSYDYDSPLSENGELTDKYYRVVELLAQYNTIETLIPDLPEPIPITAYPTVSITQKLSLTEIITQVDEIIFNQHTVAMELLPINNNTGQSYGYIVYRKTGLNIPANSTLAIQGRVCDSVMVLINGVLISNVLSSPSDLDDFGYWRYLDSNINLGNEDHLGATLELVVENWSRNNFGALAQFDQHKGIWQGPVMLNGQELTNWEIIPLEFKKSWTNSLTRWHGVEDYGPAPALYRATLNVEEPQDTYIDVRNWQKGTVIVNGFVLGRYSTALGPQLFLYLPAPLLRAGDNDIIFFEHFNAGDSVVFSTEQIYGRV